MTRMRELKDAFRHERQSCSWLDLGVIDIPLLPESEPDGYRCALHLDSTIFAYQYLEKTGQFKRSISFGMIAVVIRVHTKVVLVEGRPEDDWTEERRVAIMPKEANMKDQQLSTNPHPRLLSHLSMTAYDSEFFFDYDYNPTSKCTTLHP